MHSNKPNSKGMPAASDSGLKRKIRLWLSALFHVKQSERELDSELRFHLEEQAAAKVRAGMNPDKARRDVTREFGRVELVKEECRDERGTRWLDDLWQDIRFGLRTLRKSPGFTAIAVLTLALGIGANTAIFSVVNGVLLNPLPYPEPDRLVTLHASKPNFSRGTISYPNFLDWQRDNRSFSAIAVTRAANFILTGTGDAEQLDGEYISSQFFSLLGQKPVLGRMFTPAEDELGVDNVVAISSGLWARKFGSAQDVLGKSLTLNGNDYVIVAVIPAGFDLPLPYFQTSEIYAPMGEWPNPSLADRGVGWGIHGIGRLKPGVTLEQARADMTSVARHLEQVYPDKDKGTGATVLPLKEEVVGNVRPFLLLLLGAVGMVLLIACVNVANLLLARATGRTREIAMRAALGAGVGRLIRQMLTESMLLALAGGAVGLSLARWGTEAALAALPSALPRAAEARLDPRVLLFTLAVSACAGIVFGLIPAIRATRCNIYETLKEGGRGNSGARHRAQGALVVVEMALAIVLLIGAGLLIRSLAALWDVNPGFDPDNVVNFGLTVPPAAINPTPDAARAAFREIQQKFASTPGVESAALTWGALPLAGINDNWAFWVDGQPKPVSQNEMNWALYYVVDPSYLRVMRIPLKSGRFFTERDDQHATPVGVVDDVFARKHFPPNGDAIGKVIDLVNSSGQTEKIQIVGIVGHVKQWGLDSDDSNSLRAQLYRPFMQMSDDIIVLSLSGNGFVVRSAGPLTGVMDSIRATSRKMSSKQAIYGERSMKEAIAATLASRRFSMILLAAFAALALVLASIGLYGVIAYLVGQRTHEIGIRMALGAQPADVVRWVVGSGARIALVGVACGLVAAAGLTRVLAKSSLLFGVSATDPLTFIGVAALLMAIALAACWIPARRATRVDPMTALRNE